MRYLFTLFVVATLLTACQKQAMPTIITPDISKYLAYPDAEVVISLTTKTGGIIPTVFPVAKNTSHPTDEPANLTFRGSTGYENLSVSWICYGQFNDGDIYAISVGTNGFVNSMYEVACAFKGKEMLVLDTNEVKITIRRK